MAKSQQVTVPMEYPAFCAGDPILATATGDARLTPTQIVVENVHSMERLHRSAPRSEPSYSKRVPLRFNRQTGMEIPRRHLNRGWRLAEGWRNAVELPHA